ncbi:hypothetical protein [Streptomyces sp. WAC 04229]|uniref:hypothetical protein n=1 Tax=Streptomyces sp. WAC 04229 TaxID=2203206 RepID=UPI003D7587B6
MTTTGTPTGRAHPWGRRGRHRRPRPRKVLLAAGGLAFAAGALSLVRLLPEPGGGAGGYGAEAAPRVDPGGETATDRARTPGAARTAGPSDVSPSATSAMGGLSGSPAGGPIPAPSTPHPAASSSSSGTTTVPDAPNPPEDRADAGATAAPHAPRPPGSTHAPRPPHSDAPRPTPTPPPGRGTPPAPAPEPHDPGLCVPVIGLCVDLLGGD